MIFGDLNLGIDEFFVGMTGNIDSPYNMGITTT